jgi:hypothetical protein
MPFTFQAKKVLISITYDCFTIYETDHPKLTRNVMVRVLQGCKQILTSMEMAEPGPFNCITGIQMDPRFDRFVYNIELDHDFYHQDQFDPETDHTHVKLFKPISIDIINQLANVFANNNLFDPEEKKAFRDQWHIRNDAAVAAFESHLIYEKSQDINPIISYIKTINNVDTLLALQRHLLKNKFNYLRELTGKVKISFWRGTDCDEKVATTSKTWAMIEKAFSLQLANCMYLQFNPEASVLKERALQLISNHTFFALKRLAIPGQDKSEPNASVKAFQTNDETKFTEKYTSHFNKYR